jgi:hypothetical protein
VTPRKISERAAVGVGREDVLTSGIHVGPKESTAAAQRCLPADVFAMVVDMWTHVLVQDYRERHGAAV